MALDKSALLALFAPKIIDQDVPGVGAVRLRELSAPEVSDIREACKTEAQKADFGFLLVVASVVDDTGAPTFTTADLPALRASAQSRIGELVSAVMAVNGFSVKEDAAKKLKRSPERRMLFRLALAMGRTIEELRSVLSYAEFQEWCLYYQIEPWGEDRADLRAGIVALTIANYAGKVRAEGADPALPADFMPYLDRPEPEAPADDQPLTDDELAAWADAALFGIPPE